MAKKRTVDPQDIAGARQAAFPEQIKPSLATLVDSAPAGEDWLHEVKFDGYRILARIEGKRVRLISRNGLDWTPRFRAIAGELAKVKVKSALVDGEVIAVNAKGVSDFSALQDALSTSGASADLLYYAFDFLYLDGATSGAARLRTAKRCLPPAWPAHRRASITASTTRATGRLSSRARRDGAGGHRFEAPFGAL